MPQKRPRMAEILPKMTEKTSSKIEEMAVISIGIILTIVCLMAIEKFTPLIARALKLENREQSICEKLFSNALGDSEAVQASEIPQNAPDWSAITFESLPGVLQDGQFIADSYLLQQLGWNPSAIWKEGQTIDQFLPMGYLQKSFRLEQFSLGEIAERSLESIPLNQVRLADIGFLENQTLGSLLEAMPNLKDYHLGDLPFLQDIIDTAIDIQGNQTIEQILNDFEQLQNLKLDMVDLNSYSLDDLPDFIKTPINRFNKWQETLIADIPGLSSVPFADFPNPLTNEGLQLGYADIVLNQHQNQRSRSVVGSYQEGFNVPCPENCPHIEFSQPFWLNGVQWISGQTLEVGGGEGILGSVNGGREPAGRHPFGPAFKVVLWEVDEQAARADMVIFFNLCVKKTFVDLGCTPYIFGPIPWFPIEERMWTPF